MAWCAPCFRRNAAHGVSANLARPTKWSPRATQRQHPGTYETGGRLWDQIELARHRAGRAWRRFLAGRGCHLNLKPTSLTRLRRRGGTMRRRALPTPRVRQDPGSGAAGRVPSLDLMASGGTRNESPLFCINLTAARLQRRQRSAPASCGTVPALPVSSTASDRHRPGEGVERATGVGPMAPREQNDMRAIIAIAETRWRRELYPPSKFGPERQAGRLLLQRSTDNVGASNPMHFASGLCRNVCKRFDPRRTAGQARSRRLLASPGHRIRENQDIQGGQERQGSFGHRR